MKIKDFVKFHRKKKQLTLINLARLATISYGMLHRLESGQITDPHPDLLKKVAIALDVDFKIMLSKCNVDASQSYNEMANVDLLPIVENSIELKEGLEKRNQIVSYLNGSGLLQCKTDDFLPICKNGDFFLLDSMQELKDNNMYLICKDNVLELMFAFMSKVSNHLFLSNFPFFKTCYFEQINDPIYQVKAILPSQALHEISK